MSSHYHRAIVQRARRVENTHEQVVTKLGIKLHTTVTHVLQSNIPFDHDQRASFSRGERRRRENYFVINTLAKLPVMPRKRHPKSIPKRNQRLADLRLEEDDDRDTDVQQSVAEHELQRRKILCDGKPVEKNEGDDAESHRSGARAAQEFQDRIHKQKDEEDVCDIAQLNHPSQILGVWQ